MNSPGRPLSIDVISLGFFDEQRADDQGDGGDGHGIPQAVVDVARCRHDGKRDWREKASEPAIADVIRSEEHPSELQSLMLISFSVFCLKTTQSQQPKITHHLT